MRVKCMEIAMKIQTSGRTLDSVSGTTAMAKVVAECVNKIFATGIDETDKLWHDDIVVLLKKKFERCFSQQECETAFDVCAYILSPHCSGLPDGRFIIWRRVSKACTLLFFFFFF